MAGLDPSVYGQLQAPDPLGTLGKFATIQNQLNSSRQFNVELKARMALGQIMQQSVDPKTGQPDYQKAAILAAQNPDAAYLSPDLMSQAVQRQGMQLDNVIKNFSVAQKRLELTGNAAASLLPKGTSVTREDFTGALGNLATAMHEHGVADNESYEHIISALGSAPQGGQELYNYLQQISMQANGAKDSMDRMQNNLQTVDTGDGKHLFWMNPNFPGQQPKYVGSFAQHPTPEAQNALVGVQGANGETRQVPRAAAAPMFGGEGQLQMPQLPPTEAGPGGAPPAEASDGAPPPPARLPTPGAPVSNIGPLRTDQLKNMAGYQDNMNKEIATVNQNIQSIQQLQDLAGKVHTGMFAEERLEAGRLMKSMGFPSSAYDKMANGDLASSQEVMKYSVPNAMNTLRNSLGNQSRITNMEFGSFQRANPNLETDPKAFDKILSFSHMLMDLKQKEQSAYSTWLENGRDPVAFPEAWTQQLIKRGYVKADDSFTPYKAGK